jgi:hypothetical protein
MSRAMLLAVLPLVLLACAAPRTARGPGASTPARARFFPPEAPAVFEQAVRAAVLEGYRLNTCDADLRKIETSRVELDAPCGETTCLARQTVEVKLGYRVARVTVAREVYDGAERRWRLDGDGSAEAARSLLARIVGPARAEPRGNPCASAVRLEVSAATTPPRE